jgi:hypothetical protein
MQLEEENWPAVKKRANISKITKLSCTTARLILLCSLQVHHRCLRRAAVKVG